MSTRLTPAQRREVIASYGTDYMTAQELADHYGVTREYILQVVRTSKTTRAQAIADMDPVMVAEYGRYVDEMNRDWWADE